MYCVRGCGNHLRKLREITCGNYSGNHLRKLGLRKSLEEIKRSKIDAAEYYGEEEGRRKRAKMRTGAPVHSCHLKTLSHVTGPSQSLYWVSHTIVGNRATSRKGLFPTVKVSSVKCNIVSLLVTVYRTLTTYLQFCTVLYIDHEQD